MLSSQQFRSGDKETMSSFFLKNPRIIILVVALIAVSGCIALTLLPRLEDPRLTPRAARVTTVWPGADAERVESLVTEKLEKGLQEIEEVDILNSFSNANISFIAIELADEVNEEEADNAWARIRDKIEDVRRELPASSLAPSFKTYETPNTIIFALRWELASPVSYAILNRLAKRLQDQIDQIPGTERSEIFGEPEEEILVTLDPDSMTAIGLTSADVARTIAASDSKLPAGQLRTASDNFLMEVEGEIETLQRVSRIPIKLGTDAATSFVDLGSIARIEKATKSPPSSKVVLANKVAIVVAAQVHPEKRIDHWAREVDQVVDDFEATALPKGVSLQRIFEQEPYVTNRMQSLAKSLLYSVAAIFVVIFAVMGLRASLIVGISLPLVSLMVLSLMHWMQVPIQQMSITGLIISLGLMIDNAIVVVDEISQRLRTGSSREQSLRSGVSFLFMPLLGSTVTTALSFSPIILMPGPAGEFVGSIAVVAVFAVASSFLLTMTVIAAVASMGLPTSANYGWIAHGFSSRTLRAIYGWCIGLILRNPGVGVLVAITPAILGFVVVGDLPEQFFPFAERNQFRIDLELPASSSIEETERYANQIRERLIESPEVREVHWFIGESAPMFYYNVIPLRQNEARYAQAIVECVEGTDLTSLLLRKQPEFNAAFPSASVLLRELEQGPPFQAPIEVRIAGPDTKTLRELGDSIRLLLTQTQHVHHTSSGYSESLPKISFQIDEQQAQLAGLNLGAVAERLNTAFEGVTGGSMVEETEELPVRVRLPNENRSQLAAVESLDILTNRDVASQASGSELYQGIPLSAISKSVLVSETATINRRNGQRINEVQAYIDAGVLPAVVLQEFKQRLKDSGFELPPGYAISYGGAEEERNDAIGKLLLNAIVIVALMVAAMVIATGTFRLAALLFAVAGLSVGLGVGALWIAGLPWGFMAMVAVMGLIGIAVNDSIVVLAAIQSLPVTARSVPAIKERVVESTRHILSTTLTTIAGFTPLFLFGGDFWTPVAVVISGGVAGATLLALVLTPCSYVILYRVRSHAMRLPPPNQGTFDFANESFAAEADFLEEEPEMASLET